MVYFKIFYIEKYFNEFPEAILNGVASSELNSCTKVANCISNI